MDTDPDSPLKQLLGSSITYRIAMGPQQGRKVFTLQTLPNCSPENSRAHTVGKVAGFSLHAAVATRAHEREKLERLCRYITRPPLSTKRLALTRQGKLRYELKTPYRDGTTHIIFEPLDFIAHLVALIPKPRVNLTRYHGVFAPHSKYRARVTPAKRGKGPKTKATGWVTGLPGPTTHVMVDWQRTTQRFLNREQRGLLCPRGRNGCETSWPLAGIPCWPLRKGQNSRYSVSNLV